MMKTNVYFNDLRSWQRAWKSSLLVMLTLCCYTAQAADDYVVTKSESLAWVGGTVPNSGQLLTISSAVSSIPDDPMAGDTVCFSHTAVNESNDSLENVFIIVQEEVISFADLLLPNGIVTGSNSYVLTGSSCHILSGADIDAGFYTIPVIAQGSTLDGSDVGDCINAIACWDIRLSCTDYNISLDAACETVLTPELLDIESNAPDSLIRIRIQNEDGTYRVTARVESSDVGSALKVVVDIPGCDNISPCWSYANIEYKLLPDQVCSVETISCLEAVAEAAIPEVTASCGPTRLIRGATERVDLCRATKDTLAMETTTYTILDQFGNRSDTCTQIRYILPANIDSIDIRWPENNQRFSCNADIFDADGDVLTSIAGAPRWVTPRFPAGIDLTLSMLTPNCNVLTEWDDRVIFTRNCETTIVRTWKVTEWRCEGGYASFEFRQTFFLTDETAPQIDLQAADMTISVNQHNQCAASFQVPSNYTVSDDCQPNSTIEVEIRYPGGSSLLGDASPVIFLPLGDKQLVEYIARDGCGNESRDSLYVNVIDQTDPVAVCLRSTSTSIPNTTVRMEVDQFDEDAYDDCSIVRKCVVRMDHFAELERLGNGPDYKVLFTSFNDALRSRANCYRDYSANSYIDDTDNKRYIDIFNLCLEDVVFCCEDAGTEVPVIYRVYDQAGNDNACMVMVEVKDLSLPAVTCPAEEIIVSCDYEFDAYSNQVLDSLFGTIRDGVVRTPVNVDTMFLLGSTGDLVNGTFEDNCKLGEVQVTNVVEIDSMCGTGRIERTFSITRGGETTTHCRQTILIRGDQNNNPLKWDTFDDEITIMPDDPTDIVHLAELHPPTVMNTGCSQIGIGYRDRFFVGDGTGDLCTKVIRTWDVIDWCRGNGTALELSRNQVIYVSDDTAPEITLETNATGPASGAAIIQVIGTDNLVSDARQLKWAYQLFRGTSNTPIISDTLAFTDFRNNTTGTITIPPQSAGTYNLVVTATDMCNNTDTVTQELVRTNGVVDQASVFGQVIYADGSSMDEVSVFLSTEIEAYESAAMDMTDVDGAYTFSNMPMGGTYYLDPEKTDDPLNGVTVVDMVLMQRHILGLSQFDQSEQYVAADVNADGRVSALDMVEMRRLILGHTSEFSKKDSWTFVYEGQDLSEVAYDGLAAQEVYFIDKLETDMDITFVGIKNGDVSGDAIAHSALAETRSMASTSWIYESTLNNGWLTVQVKAGEDMTIAGAQATITWNDEATLTRVIPGTLDIDMDDVNPAEKRYLPMIVTADHNVRVAKSDVLFTLIFDATDVIGLPQFDLAAFATPNVVFDGTETRSLQLKAGGVFIEELTIQQNQPNPWSAVTEITAQLPSAGQATLSIYDLQQKLIYRDQRYLQEGTHTFRLSDRDVPQTGLFFYEVEVNGMVAREKMLRVK